MILNSLNVPILLKKKEAGMPLVTMCVPFKYHHEVNKLVFLNNKYMNFQAAAFPTSDPLGKQQEHHKYKKDCLVPHAD